MGIFKDSSGDNVEVELKGKLGIFICKDYIKN